MINIIVYESSDPLLTLRLKQGLPGGTYTPYKLDASPNVQFVVKVDPDDITPKFTYAIGSGVTIVADGTAGGALYSEISVQCNASDLTPPAKYYCYLAVTKAGKKDVVDDGILEVKNI
jgi:hypothetical protein